jgi:SPP1 gp7 family putative phage head morphogenesis protein
MAESLNGWLAQYVPDANPGVSGSPLYMGLGNIAESVFNFNETQFEKGAKSTLGVEFPVGEDWWPDAKENWKRFNYETIQGDMRKYVRDINNAVERAVTTGQTAKELSKKIQSLDNSISKSRANFIARDQIGRLNGEVTHRRMESIGLTMYVWETCGDERVRESHELMDGGLCQWEDFSVFSQDGGKTWINRPSTAVHLHPGDDYQCRCTATAYWQELVDDVDEMIAKYEELDTLAVEVDDEVKNAYTSPVKPLSWEFREKRIANDDYVKKHFPKEKFIADQFVFQSKSKYTKGLYLPENVKIAESRIPINREQRATLRKELRQAGVLSRLGNSVYLTPEKGGYKKRVTDAVVNGVPFEFRNITGQVRKIETRFGNAKEKGDDVNVFMTIDSKVNVQEVRRRVGLVINRHPKYSGKIVVSIGGKEPYFWDTSEFR